MEEQLTNESIIKTLSDKFSDSIIACYEPYDLVTFEIKDTELIPICKFLYESPYQFQFLTDICAVHYPENTGKELAIVYHLHNLVQNVRIRLKVFVSIDKPEVTSLTSLFKAANWMERETFDFFGVQFIGHPNLVRILNHDEMDYHPMRKEYHLEDETREDKDNSFFGR